MNYRTFKFTHSRAIITMTKSEYSRTTSGKSWKSKPDVQTVETITPEFYTNCIQAVPFFNDRVEHSYTPFGYIPTRTTSTAPDKSKKIIYEFHFKYMED